MQLSFDKGFNYENTRKLIQFLKTRQVTYNFELRMHSSQNKVLLYGLFLQPPAVNWKSETNAILNKLKFF